MHPPMSFRSYETVPDWARFLSMDEFQAFLDAIRHDLRSRNLLFQEREGVLVVASADGSLSQCGLSNIALKCGAAGRDAYAREIAQHFDRLFGQPEEPPPFPERFDDVRASVKVRIYREDDLERRGTPVIWQPLASGLRAVAVYDLPNIVASVAPPHLEQWGVSPEEALRVGTLNVGRHKVTREAFRIGAVELFYLMDEDGFAASQVLHLGTYFSGELGALVAMPTRHLLICCPIRTTTVIDSLQEMAMLADDIHEERAATPSEGHLLLPDVYWWKDGRMSLLSVPKGLVDLPGTVMAPPQEFIDEVLSRAELPGSKPKTS